MEKTINDIVKEQAESEEPKAENCVSCGREITTHTPQGWAEQGVCSGRCWADIWGEWDC